MVVFSLAIFATFYNDSYSVQVPKTLQKEGVYTSINDSKILFIYIFLSSLKFSFKYLTKC